MLAPASMACNPAGSISLINNDVVSSGQIKTVSSALNYGSLTMSGGTLVVCGSLTLSAFSFNSGTIVINPGASLQINTGSSIVFGNNCCIFNWGNFTITSSIVTGQNNIIYNVSTSSVFNVAFNQLVIQGPNTYVINNGLISSSYVIVQSANSAGVVCSGPGSCIVCNIMINQFANAFLSPAGPSCINITQWIINNQPMTATSNVQICYLASSVSILGSPFFGSATVNSNCPSCSVALPLQFISFSGECKKNKTTLYWSTEKESEILRFTIEHSNNGIDFTEAGMIQPYNTSGRHSYSYTLDSDEYGINYFRIKETDRDQTKYYSQIIYTDCGYKEGLVYISSSNTESIQFSTEEGITQLSIYSVTGQMVKNILMTNEKFYVLRLDEFSHGTYVAAIVTSSGKVVHKKILVY